MRIVALALALSLGACTQLQTAEKFLTGGVNNPITRTQLYEVENGAIVVFAGLNAYKTTCIRGAIPVSCMATIAAIQNYTRQIPPQLKVLRVFVKANDQVNAPLIYNTIIQLLANAKATASASGVNLGGA